jgi:hypothetical protein
MLLAGAGDDLRRDLSPLITDAIAGNAERARRTVVAA